MFCKCWFPTTKIVQAPNLDQMERWPQIKYNKIICSHFDINTFQHSSTNINKHPSRNQKSEWLQASAAAAAAAARFPLRFDTLHTDQASASSFVNGLMRSVATKLNVGWDVPPNVHWGSSIVIPAGGSMSSQMWMCRTRSRSPSNGSSKLIWIAPLRSKSIAMPDSWVPVNSPEKCHGPQIFMTSSPGSKLLVATLECLRSECCCGNRGKH